MPRNRQPVYWAHPYVTAIIISVAVLLTARQAHIILTTGETIAGNVRHIWYPFARHVLGGGVPYVGFWDNKPPVFQLVNVIAATTGSLPAYIMVFYLLIGLANGVTAVGLWELTSRYQHRTVGLLAAILYVLLIPEVGYQIDPRQLANALVLVAFLVPSPVTAGVATALAGLTTQYAVLLIPAIALFHLARRDGDRQTIIHWLIIYAGTGLAVVGAVFAVIGLLWGPAAALGGFEMTFLRVGNYSRRMGSFNFEVLVNPFQFTLTVLWPAVNSILLQFAALLGIAACLWNTYQHRDPVYLAPVLGFYGAAAALFIRSAGIYYVLILPFALFLAILGLVFALTMLVAAASLFNDRKSLGQQ